MNNYKINYRQSYEDNWIYYAIKDNDKSRIYRDRIDKAEKYGQKIAKPMKNPINK